MLIDPKIEAPLRTMLGHAIREELDDVARVMVETGEQAYRQALVLLVRASAYITIDVGKQWPTDAGLREAARIASESQTHLPVTKHEIHTYLSRVVFGFEKLDEVFTDEKRLGIVPLFTTANLLLSFCPRSQHWGEYLDTIWNSIEAADQAGLSALPALMYEHRSLGARAGKNIRPSTGK